MNKTITINLSGIVFHIDENAYEQLKQYLEKLKQYFSNTQGKEEIIADIESRIAEMFSEKISQNKNVITLEEVNTVIAAMGNPEEVAGEEKSASSQTDEPTASMEKIRRRLYRNPDDKIFGGVCGGISAYFDVDPVWIRLLWALLVVFAGTGIFIYIILWVIIPKAKTTAEKLEMRGEKVNVNTIQKNVREELEGVKDRVEKFGKKLNSDESRRKFESWGKTTENFFIEVFGALFSVVKRLTGLFIAIISIAVLVALTAALFTTAGVSSFSFPATLPKMIMSQSQLLWLAVGAILFVGVPFTMLLLNGIRLLFKMNMNLKKISVVMLFFWIAGMGICIASGLSIGKQFSKRTIVKERLNLNSVQAGRINIEMNATQPELEEEMQEDEWFNSTRCLVVNAESLLVHNVRLDIQKSDNDSAELIVIRSSRGESLHDARQQANNIGYNYSVTDSTLKLSSHYSLSTTGKFRAQNIRLILRLPVGKSVFLSKGTESILHNVDNVTDTWDEDMAGHEWRMTSQGLECVDCKQPSTPRGQAISRKNHRFIIHTRING